MFVQIIKKRNFFKPLKIKYFLFNLVFFSDSCFHKEANIFFLPVQNEQYLEMINREQRSTVVGNSSGI